MLARLLKSAEYSAPRRWLACAIVLVALSALVQSRNEASRINARITWADPENKAALESGFMALGGFRGLLADLVWVRAIAQQESGRLYELKLSSELIQKLQPTFVQVHAFLAHNMSYNLAAKAENCEDKWFWIRSGIETLEKGIERNTRNSTLWFELGFQYYDRLDDRKLEHCSDLRKQELPHYDDFTEAELAGVFTGKKQWTAGRARNNEHLRFAAYYFWKALNAGTESLPIRVERMLGHCLDRLGHFVSRKPPGERTSWEDWGSEDWWVEVWRRNREDRKVDYDTTVPTNLFTCMQQQMDIYDRGYRAADKMGKTGEAERFKGMLEAAYQRTLKYFPDKKQSMEEMLKDIRDTMKRRMEEAKKR